MGAQDCEGREAPSRSPAQLESGELNTEPECDDDPEGQSGSGPELAPHGWLDSSMKDRKCPIVSIPSSQSASRQ